MTEKDYINYGFDIIKRVDVLGGNFLVRIPKDLAEELPKKMHEIGTGNGINWLKSELKKRCNNDPRFSLLHFCS